MSARINDIYEFGPFRLEVGERRLLQDGRVVSIRAKVFDTLHALVENHNNLVSKEVLLERVWPNIVVEENNLAHNISTLRRLLGKTPAGEDHIETVPKQGYRFVADVRAIRSGEIPASEEWEALPMDIPIPANEAERVVALRTYNILDTAPEPAYDDITALAAKICDCPVARINLIDESRLWRKSAFGTHAKFGIRAQGTETPREETLCYPVIFGTNPLIVPDLTKDERFSGYPSVVGDPRYRFYCGMPLINPKGHALGTLCTLDFEPRELTSEQKEALRRLAAQVMTQLELRRALIELEDAHNNLKDLNQTLEEKVREQVAEIERVSRFKRYLSPQIAEAILQDEGDDPFKTHRREITVAFMDLRDFTAFSDHAEPEEVIEFLRGYHAEMGRLIFQHEGTVEYFAGDGLMAFFNDPIPREDHTEAAVRMAVEMQARVKDLLTGWVKRGYDLDLGIGMAAGYATMGTIGFEGRMEYGAVGNVTILASRLSTEAKGGQILTDRRTLSKIEGSVEAESLGEMNLKGFARPVAVFNVLKLKK